MSVIGDCIGRKTLFQVKFALLMSFDVSIVLKQRHFFWSGNVLKSIYY